MKRILWVCALGFFSIDGAAQAQSSLQALMQDINQLDQEHRDASTKNISTLLSSLQTASTNSDAAVQLFETAGGVMPEAAKIQTSYEHETPTEKRARQSLNQAMLNEVSGMLQLHCGMMRFGALFITQPDLPGLNDNWLAWLKAAAGMYPQFTQPLTDPRVKADADADAAAAPPPVDPVARLGAPDPSPDLSSSSDTPPRHHHHGPQAQDPATAPPKIVAGAAIKNMTLSSSVISSYLGFRAWGDSPQGKWRVADVPQLYKQQVLDPLRKKPTADTIAAWDVFIAMQAADSPDEDHFNAIDGPSLQFEKACDDFASKPSTDKVQAIVAFIKANPDHPQFEEWVGRAKDMVKALANPQPASS